MDYKVVITGLTRGPDAKKALDQTIEFLLDNGRTVTQDPNPTAERYVKQHVHFEPPQFVEYTSSYGGDGFIVIYFKYYCGVVVGLKPIYRWGVLTLIDDELLAIQLKLMS
jgi:hypothetical protein